MVKWFARRLTRWTFGRVGRDACQARAIEHFRSKWNDVVTVIKNHADLEIVLCDVRDTLNPAEVYGADAFTSMQTMPPRSLSRKMSTST
ncbi:hypothetical protein N8E89_23975 (plasmid) [Phyllobacterium sp. A18/5-2]|uniref:hypothetical protein n=1 Tax=Phyllobacterium sp. A18/5-2 TaxID=2978392 RepID=UPI0021C6C80C|nr:hypothetical protein [Phyllobacterium sp. A18/5-2]UXN66239.1 hypothetical protein N8E89_23975 [Phyllobacterium sp. A18/5-2]